MNTKNLFCILACILCATASRAQFYNILLIPDSLIKGANAVKRVDEKRLTVNSASRATYSYKEAYTILNAKGDYFAMNTEYYDKFTSIESIEANLYDAMGVKIKSLKKSDIRDLSGMGGGTEVDDNRYKEFGFYHRTYPYTVEYEVTVKMNGLMFLPRWYPISSELMGVQQASMEVVVAPGNNLLHKAHNYPGTPAVATDAKGNQVFKWELKNLKPFKSEYACPVFEELVPVVLMALDKFEMDGYAGSFASWESFGNFSYQLTKGKDVLPGELKAKVKQLTEGKTTTFDKVAGLYKYMQENTRYISIQLGIGGWMPFDAGFVYQKKYGDCKALTNYMYAMLKEAGIPSIYSLVKSGGGLVRFQEDFPSQQFDHVILCVPNGRDTIWLECTSQTLPPGYLGDFTNNRPVLLVMEKGSKLVRTPHYPLHENLQQRFVEATVGQDGSLKGKISTVYRAMQYDDIHGFIKAYGPDKQKEYLRSVFDLGTYEVTDFSYEEAMNTLPEVHEKVSFEAAHYAQITGKRIIISPNLLSKSIKRLSKDTVRKYDVVVSFPYVDRDSVILDIGEGYTTENLPKPLVLETVFGKYSARAELVNNRLIYTRELQRYEGRFPKEKYNDLVSFYDNISKADRAKVVLVKADGANP